MWSELRIVTSSGKICGFLIYACPFYGEVTGEKKLLGLLILLQQWLNDVIAWVFLILKLTAIAWHDKILGIVRRLYNV